MSQKVHPKGFRLRSTGHLGSLTSPSVLTAPEGSHFQKSSNLAWDSVWFSEPKKGKHFYTRILHEDQLIQDYTKGFFRSFGFYQQKCVIERKCNKELHITSYVLRSPKIQPSKMDLLGTRTRQEKILQEGLQQGWVPFLIQSVISKILYDKSKTLHALLEQNGRRYEECPIRGTKGSNTKVPKEASLKSKILGDHRKTKGSLQRRTQVICDWKSQNSPGISETGGFQPIPSLTAILTPQENSNTQVLTNQKRFQDLWNCWLLGKKKGFWPQEQDLPSASSVTNLSAPRGAFNAWWTHRSWNSVVYHPTMSSITKTCPLWGTNEVCLKIHK